ncbi:hypothetical protein MK805_05375 [Shimazuella sp. AN120528]|uniref:hypothetical protein n=1 Tax=Shimazuella soli TaxID=1892854 RepID=UPI001F107EA1|nr:hypothetical protein [Shimazuella soli]MCH5584396.1 hypothetical protein [Shimazuella soli]
MPFDPEKVSEIIASIKADPVKSKAEFLYVHNVTNMFVDYAWFYLDDKHIFSSPRSWFPVKDGDFFVGGDLPKEISEPTLSDGDVKHRWYDATQIPEGDCVWLYSMEDDERMKKDTLYVFLREDDEFWLFTFEDFSQN